MIDNLIKDIIKDNIPDEFKKFDKNRLINTLEYYKKRIIYFSNKELICDNFEIDDEYNELRTNIIRYIEPEIDDDLYSSSSEIEIPKSLFDGLYSDQLEIIAK
jgi:hypothetical protein